MKNLSKSYRESANLIRERLRFLRELRNRTGNREEKEKINRRIRELTPILTQMNELAELTEHYYDRGYWRGDKYTV